LGTTQALEGPGGIRLGDHRLLQGGEGLRELALVEQGFALLKQAGLLGGGQGQGQAQEAPRRLINAFS
jgi:hypothetical protein